MVFGRGIQPAGPASDYSGGERPQWNKEERQWSMPRTGTYAPPTYPPGLDVRKYGLDPDKMGQHCTVMKALKDKRARFDIEYNMAVFGAFVSAASKSALSASEMDNPFRWTGGPCASSAAHTRAKAHAKLLRLCFDLSLEGRPVCGRETAADAVTAHFELPDLKTTRDILAPQQGLNVWARTTCHTPLASAEDPLSPPRSPEERDKTVIVYPPPTPDVADYGINPAKMNKKRRVLAALKDRRGLDDPRYTAAILSTYTAHKMISDPRPSALTAPRVRLKLRDVELGLQHAGRASVCELQAAIDAAVERYALPSVTDALAIVHEAEKADAEFKKVKKDYDGGVRPPKTPSPGSASDGAMVDLLESSRRRGTT